MYSVSVKELLKLGNHANIIDIRSVEKYNDNHIPNSKNIDYLELIGNPKKYLKYNTKYYIYCQKGIQSIKVCNVLRKNGYDAINIIGGYEEWLLEK